MVQQSKVLDSLKQMGYRLTPQRVMVVTAMIKRPSHIGVDEIFQEIHKTYPYIDVATVYRTLQLLKKLLLVTELNVGGIARYELNEAERHNHMVCRECGGAFDLSPSYLEEFKSMLIKEFRFQPDLEHFAIGGVCGDCVDREATAVNESTGRGQGQDL